MMREWQYDEGLAKIEANNPGEPLLPVLRGGFSPINAIYMASALSRMPTILEEVEFNEDLVLEAEEKSEPVQVDDTLMALWSQRTALFGLMNKQSNKFHQCGNDEQRAANSALVLKYWTDIQSVKAKIAYYEEHGEMPAFRSKDSEQIADNPAKLSAQINSLRARISQRKKKLIDLAGLDANTPGRQAKIDAAENDIKTLKYTLGVAEQKMKEYGKE